MPYKIINVHPKLTPEEKEKIDRENTIFVCKVFREHDARIKKEKELAKKNGAK
ncbi:hypothetical protein [Vallitalea maricola]|uniref:Uncharacterized protein n=1 Tax=Vallitalea maricola TaxID=3074433 RepID=A0ACB5UL86_9FIRM|nr:hypothetical protein AN2V17_27600 [Vallitalea sp. AN17-2]